MKRSKFTEEQFVRTLKEADAGGTVKDLCRRHGSELLDEYFAALPGKMPSNQWNLPR